MKKTNKFSLEFRERAVRMVQEHRGEYPSLWVAAESAYVCSMVFGIWNKFPNIECDLFARMPVHVPSSEKITRF